MEKKLIEAVRDRQLLYDTSHADYMKTKLKSQIWDEVAKGIGMQSGSDAKIVWEKLRHSYRDALRRQKRCVRSGTPANLLKPWKFQREMAFLQPYMANRKRENSLIDESEEDGTTQYYEEFECEDTVIQEADRVLEPAREESDDEDVLPGSSKIHIQESPSDLPGSSRENTPTPQKQTKKKDNVGIILKQSMENLGKRGAERAGLLDMVQPSSDALYHFFMSMYETTKRMPAPSQYVVKNHIFKAVTDMEATLLHIPQTHSTTLQPSLFYQHQYDRYSDSQRSPSTPVSSYSENSFHQNSTTNIQIATSEGQEERDNSFRVVKLEK